MSSIERRRRLWRFGVLTALVLLCAQILPTARPAAAAAATVAPATDFQPILQGFRSDAATSRTQAIMALAQTGDPKADDLLEAYRIGNLYVYQDRVLLGGDTVTDADLNKLIPLLDPATHEPLADAAGKPLMLKEDQLKMLSASRKERQLVSKARILLRLSSPDAEEREAGAKHAGESSDLTEALPQLDAMAQNDPNRKVRFMARQSALLLRIDNPDQLPAGKRRQDMIATLGDMKSLQALPKLKTIADDLAEKGIDKIEPEQRDILLAARSSIEKIESHQRFVGFLENVFQGISLGSILIFMALGLSITFGLMGVINMAHGELMMIGAYSTYVMQLIAEHLIKVGVIPATAYNWYYVAALPASFLMAALVGYILEILVIRHLYRRPIESLLATWGIGLILIQSVRLIFGDNIGVSAPTWARGGVEIIQDFILPYGRSFIVVLCALCIVGIWLLMTRTRVGLLMRATMQNRDMANALGVSSANIDRFTFALGSGIAGLAGYAWTLIGGVTPDMGQKNFIVDSFLIVVTGGVGQLAGVVCSGLGIGVTTKVIEPMQIGQSTLGAIWAKVVVLLLIIAFIQFRPSGLFAPKGRHSDV